MKNFKKNPNELYEKFNDELYRICRQYPSHKDPQEVYLKTLIIGRTYSVSPERIKNPVNTGKDFWREFCLFVVKSNIDNELNQLQKIKKKRKLSSEDKEIVFYVFSKVHEVFKKGSKSKNENPNRISFTSKYLHFHFPNLFYIFDSFAKKGILYSGNSYEVFYKKCDELREKKQFKTPRDLDNHLLYMTKK